MLYPKYREPVDRGEGECLFIVVVGPLLIEVCTDVTGLHSDQSTLCPVLPLRPVVLQSCVQ